MYCINILLCLFSNVYVFSLDLPGEDVGNISIMDLYGASQSETLLEAQKRGTIQPSHQHPKPLTQLSVKHSTVKVPQVPWPARVSGYPILFDNALFYYPNAKSCKSTDLENLSYL